MKKFIAILAAFVVSVSMMAQGHMTFKGIEFNCSVQSFMSQLREKGFAVEDAQNAVMVGKFTGEDVTLQLFETPVSHKVYSIIVMYEPIEEDAAVFGGYDLLKDRLSSKYGLPTEVNETIEDPYSRTFFPRLAFQSLSAEYQSTWQLENGRIMLGILSLSNDVRTVISYSDKDNVALLKQEIEDDL